MQNFPKSASSFINDFHGETLEDVKSVTTGRLDAQGPSMLSYEFPAKQSTIPAHSPDKLPHSDYFQIMQLSDELYANTSYFASRSEYQHIANLRNVMGFVVGPSFSTNTPAGEMSSSESDSIAYLFSAPCNESEEFTNNINVDRKGICIYFDRDQIEPSLGMNFENFPKSLINFYESSQHRTMFLPFSLPHSASVVAKDLLCAPAEGPLRYRQISTAANYLLLQMLQALSAIDDVVDPYEERLERARQLLMDDFQSSYTLDSLARQVGVGKTTFVSEFKARYGVTATELRREARLREALRLVRQTNKPLALIADETGFSSQNNFSTAFKDRFHITPRQARSEWAKQT